MIDLGKMRKCDEPGCDGGAAFCINMKAYCPLHEPSHRHEFMDQRLTLEQIQLLLSPPDKKDIFLGKDEPKGY